VAGRPFGQHGIAARTDYFVNGRHDCLVFLTASKPDGHEGRPLCARTSDGGRTWKFVSWIVPDPKGYAIMPSTVRLGEQELLTAIRAIRGQSSARMARSSPFIAFTTSPRAIATSPQRSGMRAQQRGGELKGGTREHANRESFRQSKADR
jgi:hypothetical protein